MLARRVLRIGDGRSRSDLIRRLHTSSTAFASTSAAPQVETSDPLIAYRALAAKGIVQEDSEQIRALIELRKLTRVLQDYTPPSHLLGILSAGSSASTSISSSSSTASPYDSSEANVNALVRYLSEEEQIAALDTPRGIILTGKPGTGKTFLVDLWFDHLPIQAKFRRHYH